VRQVSIRWRIALWNTAAFAVVLVGFGSLVYGLLRQTHYDQVDRVLRSRYQQITADERLAAEPQERLKFWVRKFGKHVEISGLVRDANGRVVARAEQLAEHGQLPVPEDQTSQPHFDSLTLPQLGHMRRLSVPVVTDDGSYTLMLLAELEHVDEELGLVVRALLMTIPFTLILAAGLAYFLACKALAPVEQLRRLTDEITAERLDRRLPIANPADELGHLARTINSMIARLERSFDEVRRFTADASHELRTPIAVIRSEAEMGADDSEDLDEARSRFRSILEESARLTSTTSQLLTLSRTDAGVAEAAQQLVHLQPLLAAIVESMQPLASAKEQQLRIRLNCEPLVAADPERLRQVFHNLIDNAIKYTPAGGEIAVALDCRGTEAIIQVEDNGIGIAPEHVPHIFERFYRVNKGNSSIDDGSGLGLSIVQGIVTSLNGRVEVESIFGTGTSFRVYLEDLKGTLN